MKLFNTENMKITQVIALMCVLLMRLCKSTPLQADDGVIMEFANSGKDSALGKAMESALHRFKRHEYQSQRFFGASQNELRVREKRDKHSSHKHSHHSKSRHHSNKVVVVRPGYRG